MFISCKKQCRFFFAKKQREKLDTTMYNNMAKFVLDSHLDSDTTQEQLCRHTEEDSQNQPNQQKKKILISADSSHIPQLHLIHPPMMQA